MKYESKERNCPICNANNWDVINQKSDWSKTVMIEDDGVRHHDTDVICKDCGVIYKNPMLTRESQREFYKEDHLKLYMSYNINQISKKHIADSIDRSVRLLDWLRDVGYSVDNKSVFEIGAGVGTTLKALLAEGASEAYGIEACERDCEIADKMYGINIGNYNFDDFQTDSRFDLICILNTLEHLYSPVEALKAARELLTEEGMVLVEVPSYEFPYPGLNPDGFLSSAHNVTFDEESFRILAEKCGFGIEHLGYAGHKRCMLILLKKQEDKAGFVKRNVNASLVAKRLNENFSSFSEFSAIKKELFGDSYVISSIGELSKKYENNNNLLHLIAANAFIEQGKYLEALEFLNKYSPNQPEDEGLNEGAFLHSMGIVYRQLGDLYTARKCLKSAMDKYPKYDRYNFIKELTIDGIISDLSFMQTPWYSCKRMLRQLG